MDVKKYPVYFEVPNLDPDKKDKLQSYFKIRRRSGGGECGPVEKVHDNVYKILFNSQKDQERVLQKGDHVVEIQGHRLTLVLLGSEEPGLEASLMNVSSPTPMSTRSSGHSLSGTLPPSGGERHTVLLDLYLQRYLNESPKAVERLQQLLSLLGCSLQLPLVDGQPVVVVVRSSGQTGLEGDGDEDGLVGGWKEQVDRLFEKTYMSHFVVEQLKIQQLLASSQDGEEGVRVYSEVGQGFAVLVGDTSQVKARLEDLSVTTQVESMGLRVNQEQTRTICRLGEAKLRLLGEGLEKEVSRVAPGVLMTRGDMGQLVLEGSPSEVLKARAEISKRESQVLDRVVLEGSPFLTTFLRDVYGGQRALGDLLGWGREVEVEVGHTELRLLSLSSGRLDEAEEALLREFTEVKIEVPNCAAVPPELRSKLEAWERRAGRRVSVVFGSGARVHLLGHTEQVLELSEEIGGFLIDQSKVEERVRVPWPEMVNHLPELLERLELGDPEVEVLPDWTSPSFAQPTLVLRGPSRLVAQLRSKLTQALSSVVRESVTIDQPGALRYFQGQGKEYLQMVGRTQRCLILLEGQGSLPSFTGPSGTRPQLDHVAAAKYRLPGGLEVEVRQGDITEERADALVNAANENLDHAGGVAAALSRAGGPEVQRASTVLARQVGKVATGSAVETTGGNLPCKMLLHAVGPVGGRVGGKEGALVEQAARAALRLASTMGLQTLAMPCISSGIYGVPVRVCAESIVAAVREFDRGQHSLTRVTLIDQSEEAVRAMQVAGDRMLGAREGGTESGMEKERERESGREDLQREAPSSSATGTAEVCVRVEIVQGSMETQQVDALVSPMLGSDPLSSRVGQVLSEAAGPGLQASFSREAGGPTTLGQKVLVEGLFGLMSGRVFFINCARWDNNPQGPAVEALKQGIRRVLISCENRGFASVAFPVLGTGVALGFPHDVAARVLLEEIKEHQQNRTSRTPFLIRIVIHSSNTEALKAFKSAQGALRLKGVTIEAQVNQTPSSSASSSLEVTVMVRPVTLQLVHGDITSETTDVIVNTIDFLQPNQTGVSKAILNAAGPQVQGELAQAGKPTNYMCSTGPGALGCKEIFHASFMCDRHAIKKIVGKILKHCERNGHRSVSFPAVNTGAGGMDSAVVCKAMVEGLVSMVTGHAPIVLSLVRIVVLQDPVFQAFRSELESHYLGTVQPPLTLKEKAHQVFKNLDFRSSSSSSSSTGPSLPSSVPPSLPLSPWKPPPAVLYVLGPESGAASRAKRNLESILQQQHMRRDVEGKDLRMLTEPELRAVQEKVRDLGLSLELGQARAGAGAGSGPPDGDVIYVLRGLKEDVQSINHLLDQALSGALRRDLQEKDEALMAFSVQWSMLGPRDVWTELGLRANYLLEMAHREGRREAEVEGPGQDRLFVNLSTNMATDRGTDRRYKVRREERKCTACPEHWEPMAEGEVLRKVQLSPGSQEFLTVAQGFLSTAGNYTISKIERVQNPYLWQAYALCKKRIRAKNGEGEVGERKLYHGTNQASCGSIEKTGFNRSFAHITAYGVGVYFAVNARYSASDQYSRPEGGVKRMYVALVLTGRYTLGNSTMKVTPPRGSDLTDRFDSLVDNQQAPGIFVTFHDDQAYPEYLITFS